MFELRGTEGGGEEKDHKGGNLVCCWIFDPLCALGAILYYQRFPHFVNSLVEHSFPIFLFTFSFFFFFGRRTNSMINKKESKAKLFTRIPFVWLICADTNFI